MKQVILFFALFFFFFWNTSAAINFTLTPIKYEIELAPGQSQTYTASIKNNSTETVTLPTSTSDFVARDESWVPSFVRKSELVFADQQLSTWITLSQSSVTVDPGEEETINFTINVPNDATPGGKYGAVFFKNPWSETSGGWEIGVNVDYGILILLKVKGSIIVDPEIEDPIIKWGHSDILDNAWYLGQDENDTPVYQFEDDCPLWDFTISKYDYKCFEIPFVKDPSPTWNQNTPEPVLFESPFEVEIAVPIKNNGNIHVKPTGKIVLEDEDGNIIKAIGKESITNDYGAIIGEKVVDYIPFNDEGGNVLPNSKRLFQSYWKGFPYQTYDDAGNQIIKYWSPSEYYTNKNKKDAGFLMFWERVSEIRQHKKITANIEIRYDDENGEEIVFNSAKDFEIQYIEEWIGLNPYIFLSLWLILFVIIFIIFAIRWWMVVGRKRKCWNCKKEIKAHWETCPYCESIQNKRKMKKVQKIEEKVSESVEQKTEKNEETKKHTPKIKDEIKSDTTVKRGRGRPKKEEK